jgi:hypothetical protein
MLLIEIIDAGFDVKSGTSFKTGKGVDYSMRVQHGIVVFGPRHMQPIDITLDKNQAAYGVGKYTLDNSSFRVGDFDSLVLDRIKLVPVVASASVAPPAKVG